MQTINAVPALLKLANVSALTIETIPNVLKAITDNRIRLEGEALRHLTLLLKSAPLALTSAYKTILVATQKADKKNDKQSLKFIKGLLKSLKSSGISDERFDSLAEQIVNNEHEIKLAKTNRYTIWGGIVLTAISFVVHTLVDNKTKPIKWNQKR